MPRPAAASTRFCRRCSRRAGKPGRDMDLAALIQGVQAPPFQKIGVLDVDAFYPSKERFALGDETELGAGVAGVRAVARRGAARRRPVARTDRRGSRACRSSRSRTSTIRGGCSSSRCCSTRSSAGCGGRAAPAACAPLSTWTRSPATSRRWRIRRRRPPLHHAAEAGARVRHRHRPRVAEHGGSRLQGPRERRDLVPGPAADRARQGARARRARRRGGRRARSRDRRQDAVGAWPSACSCSHDVHAGAPVTFQSRWAMSYLRGPLSREQIKALTAQPAGNGDDRRPVQTRPHGHDSQDHAESAPGVRRGAGACTREFSSTSFLRPAANPALRAGRARRGARHVRGREAENRRDA